MSKKYKNHISKYKSFDKEVFARYPFKDRLKDAFSEKGYDISKRRGIAAAADDMLKDGLFPKLYEDVYYEGDGRSRQKNAIINAIQRHRDEFTSGKQLTGEWLGRYCQFLDCSADYLMGYIDRPTHEYTDINKQTGLSDKSINTLKHLKRCDKELAIFNFITENSFDFLTFLGNMALYMNNEYNIPIHYDKNIQDFVETNELEDSIMVTPKGERFLTVGKSSEKYPEHFDCISVPTSILESHAMQNMQNQIRDWQKLYKKSIKRNL